MPGARIRFTTCRWWRQVQDDVGQTAEPTQAMAPVEITGHWYGTGATPVDSASRIAQQGVDTVLRGELDKDAAGDVPAADDQDFLHAGIVADDRGEAMRYQVTVQPSGRQFVAEADETLLDAALRQGLTMPYGCKDGACGACKGQVLNGSVDHGKAQLSDADKATGLALYCCTRATSDLVIECKQLRTAHDIPVKTLPARIEKLERLAPDVIELQLRLPANEHLQFLAGQYIDILLKDGRKRSFSLANAPGEGKLLELHIRHVPGGFFTEQVFTTMKARDILRFSGPHGGFFLKNDASKPVILLAGGTGFAPIKAIVEQAIADGYPHPLHIYWGAKARVDLYQDTLPAAWAAAHTNIHYVPVLSEPAAGNDWQGRTGFVHRAVVADFPNLSGFQVYACGSPVMIDVARKDFVSECGLPEDEFFSDAFTFSPS
jgi:CDP-4-dehydro-6-deoxyglucose reductase, E3